MAYEKDFMISFVRHAQSRGNVGLPYEHMYHKDDPPLSPEGIIQARCLAESKITDTVTKIYAGTLIRTVQTAYPTAEKLSKEIILLPDLMEVDTTIAGTDHEILKRDYPLAVPCTSEPTPTGGKLLLGDESTEDKAARAKRCMDYFYSVAEAGDHLMVVSHGSYFGFLIRAALGISLPESFCWQVDNCCVTRVIFRKDGLPKLSFANFTGHLDSCL
ncbi:MAG: histidine phosphatase family protein [Clostridia bacterium]|nr:histidine phosphatase family protein [Clostridia bacterium]